MNRTIEEVTIQRYHYENHSQLGTHLNDAYNFAKRMRLLAALPPMNSSANAGKMNHKDLLSIQPIKPGLHN
jgi:hypothetical protein